MKVNVSLFSNGSMLSQYDDGRPAFRYSGDWKKLKLLERDMNLYKKSGLPANELPTEVEAYFVVSQRDNFVSLAIPFVDLQQITNLIKSK